jgi:putative transposase
LNYFRFAAGQRIILREREYEIMRSLSNGDLQIKDVITEAHSGWTRNQLITLYFEGQLTLRRDESPVPYARKKAREKLTVDFTQIPGKDREAAKRKFAYVRAVLDAGLDSRTQKNLAPLISAFGESIKDETPPSWIQVYRWCRDYLASGEDIRSLLPLHDKKGNRNPRISSEVMKVIDTVIAEKFLSVQRLSIQAVYDAVIARIARENTFRDRDDQEEIPSYEAIYRKVNKLDPYEVMKARHGKRAADLKFGALAHGIRPTRVLERVEIDHTKMDLFVVDIERMMPIGRPWLTTAIDVYTKAITGMYISFNPPSYLSVMQCLLHAISPKNYLKVKYPRIADEWDTYGIMETAVVDNGKEFRSDHFEDACLQLGIQIQYTPVRVASYKPSIERYFGSINKGLLHRQPGTSFSNIFEKEDYDSKKNAVIDFKTLLEIVHKWIVSVYHKKAHRGIHDIPALRWRKSIEQFPPALPASPEELKVLLGMIQERVISASGIELNRIFYNSKELALLRRHEDGKDKVKIKLDPTNLSTIHVFDSRVNAFITVPAVDQEYTAGLTLWQHNVIKRYVRNYLKENCDMVSLALAKEEIQKMVDEAWKSTKRTSTRQKSARWLDLSQDMGGEMEPQIEYPVDAKQTEVIQSADPLTIPAAAESPLCGISDIGQNLTAGAANIGPTIISPDKKEARAKKRRHKKREKFFKKDRLADPVKKGVGNSGKLARINAELAATEVDDSGWDVCYAESKR